MQKLITTVLFALITVYTTLAGNFFPVAVPANPNESTEFSCNLAPPGSFYPSIIGANHVVLNWSSVPGAGGYEIRAYQGGSQYGTTLSLGAGTTSADFDGLQPGQTYTFRIWTKCTNGERGLIYRETSATTIIIEYIAMLESSCANPGTLVGGGNGSFVVNFNWVDGATYWGYMRNSNNDKLAFRIELNNTVTSSYGTVRIVKPETTLEDADMCVIQGANCMSVDNNGHTMKILVNNEEVGRFTLNKSAVANQLSNVTFTNIQSAYLLDLYYKDCGGQEGGGGGGYVGHSEMNASAGSVNNPFHDLLIYTQESISDEDVTLSLMDMSGRVLRSQTMAGGQEQYTLQTADIQPGLYVLRVQTGARAPQVKQVVKTN